MGQTWQNPAILVAYHKISFIYADAFPETAKTSKPAHKALTSLMLICTVKHSLLFICKYKGLKLHLVL